MRKLLLSLLVLCLSSPLIVNGQKIVGDTLLASYTKQQVDSIFSAFSPQLGAVGADNGIEIYRIRYQMLDWDSDTTLVTGAIVRPTNISCPAPMLSYLHGTTTLKRNVPSFKNRELLLGIVFAGKGFYATMPDYLGLGESPGLHPYLHSETQAMSSIQLLRAGRTFANQQNTSTPLNDQLFILGYSQGGHAAMATHKKIEKDFSNEFDVTAAAPMSGPYDLSGVMTNVMLNDSSKYPAPAYLPYLFFGHQQVYDTLDYNYNEVFVSPFDSNLRPLFNGKLSLDEIADSSGMNDAPINEVPIRIMEDSVVQNFKNNKDHPLRVVLRDNDTWRNWSPQAPIKLHFCTDDGQVKYKNSVVAYDSLKAKGANIDTVNNGNKGHGECINPSIRKALLWFLGEKKNYRVNVNTTPDSGQGNGRAVVIPPDNFSNFNYSWSNGASDSVLTNLSAGTYTVTVTIPSINCTRTKNVTISQFTSASYATSKKPLLEAYPNPSQNDFRIKINNDSDFGDAKIQLFNTTGKLVKTIHPSNVSKSFTIQSDELNSGVYFLKYQQANNVDHLKLVKN